MDKIKIVVVSTNADASGAPNHVLSLVEALKHKVHFFAVFGEDGPAIERLNGLGVSTAIVPEMRSQISPRSDMIALKKVRDLIKSFAPNVVHCHSTKAGMIGRIAAASLGIASVYTVHGWGWRGLGLIGKFLVFAIEAALRFTPKSKYIFVSHSVSQEAQNILFARRGKGTTVYNGLPNLPYSEEPTSPPLKILMPARVAKAKDHETLIKAFELLQEDAKLVLCGSDTNSSSFRNLVEHWAPTKKDRIELLGQRLDVVELLNNANVFALISNFEALPISIIEAMRAKRAIIATNVGGISELIQDEVSGILVPSNDVPQVHEALSRMTDSNTREELSRSARKSFEKSFLSTEMAESVFQIYSDLAHSFRRRTRGAK